LQVGIAAGVEHGRESVLIVAELTEGRPVDAAAIGEVVTELVGQLVGEVGIREPVGVMLVDLGGAREPVDEVKC
jgi:hypothetical protein